MFRVPCPECTAFIASKLEEEPLASAGGRPVLHHCPHEMLGVFLVVREGVVADWSVWPAGSIEQMRARYLRATHDSAAGIVAESQVAAKH